ncbi:MAG: hypothetical protein WC455_30985 [Dehalococcoidia bacterium]|jgi:hypothetical protein
MSDTTAKIREALERGRANTEYAESEHGDTVDVSDFDKALALLDAYAPIMFDEDRWADGDA